jgi:hypothetical protein
MSYNYGMSNSDNEQPILLGNFLLFFGHALGIFLAYLTLGAIFAPGEKVWLGILLMGGITVWQARSTGILQQRMRSLEQNDHEE